MASITLPTAILGAGALGVGGGIASSLIGSNAAQSAAAAQEAAANNATNTQLNIYRQTQSNLAPYNQVGQSALSQLASLFGLGAGGPSAATAANATSALQNYPGYQFGFNSGLQALDRSAASQGLLLSGGQVKAAQQYGQGYAMQNAWQPYISSLSQLAQLGESAGAQAGTIGANTGANVGNSQLAAGQAAASGLVGSANALTSGLTSSLGTGLNSGLLSLALQQAYNQTPITTTGANFGVSPSSPYYSYPEL